MHTKQINRYLLIYAFVIIALLLTNCSYINAPRLDAAGVWIERDGTVYYHIEPGDSLTSIAGHTNVPLKSLIELNADMLDETLTIYAGQDLVVGTVEQATAQAYADNQAQSTGTASPHPDSGKKTIHVVQEEETLSEIATLYGLSVDSLIKINNLAEHGPLYVGQKLNIWDTSALADAVYVTVNQIDIDISTDEPISSIIVTAHGETPDTCIWFFTPEESLFQSIYYNNFIIELIAYPYADATCQNTPLPYSYPIELRFDTLEPGTYYVSVNGIIQPFVIPDQVSDTASPEKEPIKPLSIFPSLVNLSAISGLGKDLQFEDWSPTQDQIVLSRQEPGEDYQRNLFLLNPDGSGLTRLTDTPGIDMMAQWSPDGSQIVFAKMTGNFDPSTQPDQEIFLLTLSTGKIVQLTDAPGFSMEPKWSPDGKYIAFSSTRSGTHELYSMKANGSYPQQITDKVGIIQKPQWSPDGQALVFQVNLDNEGAGHIYLIEIYNLHLTGIYNGNLTQLTNSELYDSNPHWSPDGQQILFERSIIFEQADLMMIDVDGTNLQRLTHQTGMAFLSAWSPDGSMLSFFADWNGNWDLYIIDFSGDTPLIKFLDRHTMDEFYSAWSPDSQSLLFLSNPPHSLPNNLFLIDISDFSVWGK